MKIEASRSWAFILYPAEGTEFTPLEIAKLTEYKPRIGSDLVRHIVGSPIHKQEDEETQDLPYMLKPKELAPPDEKSGEIDINGLIQEQAEEQAKKKQHIHILINFVRRVRLSTAQYVASNAFLEFAPAFTQVFRVSDHRAYFRYLFHADNVEKEQFGDMPWFFKFKNEQSIDYFFKTVYKRRFLTENENTEMLIIELEQLIKENQPKNLLEFVTELGENFQHSHLLEMRVLCRKHRAYFTQLIADLNSYQKNKKY